jgi:hypothetical protein
MNPWRGQLLISAPRLLLFPRFGWFFVPAAPNQRYSVVRFFVHIFFFAGQQLYSTCLRITTSISSNNPFSCFKSRFAAPTREDRGEDEGAARAGGQRQQGELNRLGFWLSLGHAANKGSPESLVVSLWRRDWGGLKYRKAAALFRVHCRHAMPD